MISYSFNGIILPALPEWDKTIYPYACLCGDGSYYELNLCMYPFVRLDDDSVTTLNPPNTSCVYRYSYNKDGDTWDAVGVRDLFESIGRTNSFWCNIDIYEADYIDGEWKVFDTVALSASEPIVTTYADTPVLSTNFPYSKQYTYRQNKVANALTVFATIRDEGVLSYQWYCDEEAITDATESSYMPTTREIGSKRYSCQVTNTLEEQQTVYMYNGVELPKLPEWDRDKYPYVVIYTHEDENEYVLDMYSEQPSIYENDEGDLVYGVKNGCEMMYWANIIYPGMDWPKEPYDAGFYDGWRKTSHTSALWTNIDILNEDNTLSIAASEPVPVDGAEHIASVITDTVTVIIMKGVDEKSLLYGWLAGQRVAQSRSIAPRTPVAHLYNGVKLQTLPWWDKETYPYATICASSGIAVIYWVIISKIKPTFSKIAFIDGLFKLNFASIDLLFYAVPDYVDAFAGSSRNWEKYEITDSTTKTWDALWANFDICDSDGNVVLAASEPVPILPSGYTLLDYIETTGSQYIDTGFVPNQDTRIVCEFMYFSGEGIYGARTTTASNNFNLRVISSKWQPGYSKLCNTTVQCDTNWHVADQNKNLFYLDGCLVIECPVAVFTSPKSIAVGGINATNRFYYGSCRYRACKIYDNDVLVRYFFPCIDTNGNIGMYDSLNAVFYSNAGSGTFVAGTLQSS